MRVGAGGILSTVPDLAQFLLAHMNQGKVNGVQILKPETIELMHKKLSTSGVGDYGQAGVGLGWTHRMSGTDFNLRGSQGHSGSNPGYRCQMWMVEQDQGTYGIILMTNLADIYKPDWIWNIGTTYSMQKVLLNEAETLFSQISTT
jgi:CubicO group peptidase (beta-lactamase class C family)